MSKKKPQKKKPKYTTLKLNDRIAIQVGLDEGLSARAIAQHIGRSASTVQREINKYSLSVPHKHNDCVHRRKCKSRYSCGDYDCNANCQFCAKCSLNCRLYEPIRCERRFDNYYGFCNGCHRWGNCTLDKCRYEAEYANKQSKEIKSECNSGYDLTAGELIYINDIVSPLIKKGLSVYAIKSQLGDNLPVSESTLRRLINDKELEVRNGDLRIAVKMRPRRNHRRKMKNEIISKSKVGHLYSDYLDFIKNNDCMVCQMDCVEGIRSDNKVLLTLHFPMLHFQLAFLMEHHTSACVVETMDLIEENLGQELYNKIFGVILTDNGHEFLDIDGMEKSVYGGQRTKIFFCEPNMSIQKAHCETNHKLIRYILPKKTSFENLVQPDICLMMSHINSYPRESLCGQTPFKVAQKVFPAEFFDALGIDEIDFNSLNLTPSLLK